MLHKNIPASERHAPWSWEFADEAARLSATGFSEADVGKLALQLSDMSGWILLTTAPTWGTQGAAGPAGPVGPAGASAYEVAVANGFVGTEAEWLSSLTGPAGADGADGADGSPGADGAPGASAYEIAVANGFAGTEAEWLASLVGPPGSGAGAAVTLTGDTDIFIGEVKTYTISNYSSFSTYSVAVTAGSASIAGNEITFTAPNTAQTVTMTVTMDGADAEFSLVIQQASVATPTITTPVDGVTDMESSLFAETSAFATVGLPDTHTSTDWQLATDSGFASIVAQSMGDTANLEAWLYTELVAGTTYYLRVRHNGTNLGASEWSATKTFATKASVGPESEQGVLVASDKVANGKFGYSVALSADGTYALIGASGVSTNRGAAYVFTRSGTSWSQQAKLMASDGAASDQFGVSVAISSDGTYALIGATGADPGGTTDAGAAYVFVRSGTSWSQQAKLVASDPSASSRFGFSVALSSDGAYALIGATGVSTSRGAAYVFIRSGTSWSQQAKLLASDGVSNDRFGLSTSISSDGTYALIGAWGVSTYRGAAYVFIRSGTSWSQQAKLLASDGVSNDKLGWSVAISPDGTYALVGAYEATYGGMTAAGALYVFNRSGTNWTEQAKLSSLDIAGGDIFGASCAINETSDCIIVGARDVHVGEVGDAGAAYVFVRSGTSWSQQAKLVASDPSASSRFGFSVALSSDGAYALVGAFNAAPGGTSNAGAAYVFV